MTYLHTIKSGAPWISTPIAMSTGSSCIAVSTGAPWIHPYSRERGGSRGGGGGGAVPMGIGVDPVGPSTHGYRGGSRGPQY